MYFNLGRYWWPKPKRPIRPKTGRLGLPIAVRPTAVLEKMRGFFSRKIYHKMIRDTLSNLNNLCGRTKSLILVYLHKTLAAGHDHGRSKPGSDIGPISSLGSNQNMTSGHFKILPPWVGARHLTAELHKIGGGKKLLLYSFVPRH